MDGWCEVRRNFISAKSNLELLVKSVCQRDLLNLEILLLRSELFDSEFPVNSLCLLSY